MFLTELNFKDISLISGHTQIHKSSVLVLLSDLEYHRILEVKETCRDHLIQFNIGGCSAIFLVSLSCIGCTTAKASKQIYFHIYPFAIQSPPAASRTSQQVNQIMLLPVWNSLKASAYFLAALIPLHLLPSKLIPSHTKGLASFLIQGLCAWSSYCPQSSLNLSLLIPCSHDQVHLSVSFKKQNKTETLLKGPSLTSLHSILYLCFFHSTHANEQLPFFLIHLSFQTIRKLHKNRELVSCLTLPQDCKQTGGTQPSYDLNLCMVTQNEWNLYQWGTYYISK